MLQNQSQPLGVGLEVGLVRRGPRVDVAVHRRTVGPRPPAGADATGIFRRRAVLLVRAKTAHGGFRHCRSRDESGSQFCAVGRGLLDADVFRPAALGSAPGDAWGFGGHAVAPYHRRSPGLSGVAGGRWVVSHLERAGAAPAGGGRCGYHGSSTLPDGGGARAESGQQCHLGTNKSGGLRGRADLDQRRHCHCQRTRRARVCRPGRAVGWKVQGWRRTVLRLFQQSQRTGSVISLPFDVAHVGHHGSVQRVQPEPLPALQYPHGCGAGGGRSGYLPFSGARRGPLAPAGPDLVIAPFLALHGTVGRFWVFDAHGGSYFDVVDVVASVKTTKNNFFDVNDRWLQSDWVPLRAHLWLDWQGDAPPRLPRVPPDEGLPAMQALPSPGEVLREERNGEVYQAELEAVRPSFALFKMTWHANWKAYL